ncbi:MAG: WYL domain-containing protein [Phycisphaerales bacterium]|nr:MAG: WYL domain-containing protein [Phycisphaerales bacterium]
MTEYAPKFERLLQIMLLVQAERGWTAPRMAQEFGVSERSVYRDIKVLRSVGVPLESHGREGYRVRADYFLPPVQLTADEALSLVVLCEHVANREQIAFLRPAWRAVTKIRAHLPADLRTEIDALSERMLVRTAQSGEEDGSSDVYERVRRAIVDRRTLRCVYDKAHASDSDAEREQGGENGPEEFDFEPYALFFSVRAWYAIGRHGGRDAVRSLKLTRFSKIEPTDRPYDIPKGFSIEKHLGHAWRMIRGEDRHDVEVWFDPSFAQTIADTRWHATQEIEEHDDGSATFRCTVDGLDEILWWVLSMGPHCRVIKPAALAERVRTVAADTARLYEPA